MRVGRHLPRAMYRPGINSPRPQATRLRLPKIPSRQKEIHASPSKQSRHSMTTSKCKINLDGGGFSSVRKGRFKKGTVDLTTYAGVVVTLETTSGQDTSDVRVPLVMHLQFHDMAARLCVHRPAGGQSRVQDERVYLSLSSLGWAPCAGRLCNTAASTSPPWTGWTSTCCFGRAPLRCG